MICLRPDFSNSLDFFHWEEGKAYLLKIGEIALKAIHSEAVQCVSVVASIGVVTVLLVSNPMGWAAIALSVGVIAIAIFSISDSNVEEEGEKTGSLPSLLQNQEISLCAGTVAEKVRELQLGPNICTRYVAPDGNCFYTGLAVGLLEWLHAHPTDSFFSLSHFKTFAEQSNIDEPLKAAVLQIVQKVSAARGEEGIEGILRQDENIHPLIRFFREITAQSLEELSPSERNNVCVDAGFEPGLVSWFFTSVLGYPFSDFQEIITHVRKSENVEYKGWAFDSTIIALSEKLHLPFCVWKDRTSSDGSRILDLASGIDKSRGAFFPVHLFCSHNHYHVLYGVTQEEVRSRRILFQQP